VLVGKSEYDTLTFFGRPFSVFERDREAGGAGNFPPIIDDVRFGTCMRDIEGRLGRVSITGGSFVAGGEGNSETGVKTDSARGAITD
jgi:hypothetical protein